MSTGRFIARAAVSAVASLALVTGVAPGGLATATAAEVSAACTAEGRDVAAAKKKVKKAKKSKKKAVKKVKAAKKTRTKADDNKAKKAKKKAVKKLQKAKKNLKAQKAQRKQACAATDPVAADRTAALNDLASLLALLDALKRKQTTTLPPQVRAPANDAADRMVTQLEPLQSLIPGADTAALTQIVAELEQLRDLAVALEGLAGQLQDPDVQVLVEALLAGLPDADLGPLTALKSALVGALARLQSFDPSSGGVETLTADLLAAAQSLQTNAQALKNLVETLAFLNDGTMPTDPAVVGDLLTALSGLNGGALPVAPEEILVVLTGLLDGSAPTEMLPPELGDLIDEIIDVLLPGDGEQPVLPLPLPLPEVPLPELPGVPIPLPELPGLPIPLPELPGLPQLPGLPLTGSDLDAPIDDIAQDIVQNPVLDPVSPVTDPVVGDDGLVDSVTDVVTDVVGGVVGGLFGKK